VQGRDQLWALVNTVMSLHVPFNVVNVLTTSVTVVTFEVFRVFKIPVVPSH
jgi:hypothetical protein